MVGLTNFKLAGFFFLPLLFYTMLSTSACIYSLLHAQIHCFMHWKKQLSAIQFASISDQQESISRMPFLFPPSQPVTYGSETHFYLVFLPQYCPFTSTCSITDKIKHFKYEGSQVPHLILRHNTTLITSEFSFLILINIQNISGDSHLKRKLPLYQGGPFAV